MAANMVHWKVMKLTENRWVKGFNDDDNEVIKT